MGYVDENFPIAVTAVMKEEPGMKELTDQASDMHYSIGRLINSNPTLGVEGVNPGKDTHSRLERQRRYDLQI